MNVKNAEYWTKRAVLWARKRARRAVELAKFTFILRIALGVALGEVLVSWLS